VLPATYQILSNILLSMLTPYIGKIIFNHQYGCCCNRPSSDKIFYICQILEKKCEYSRTAHHYLQILRTFENGWANKMCLNKTCSKVCIGKNVSDAFPIQNGLKYGSTLSLLLLIFALEYAIRKDWN